MIHVLQDQAAQTYDVLHNLQALQSNLALDQIGLHSLAAVVTVACAILLLRTASGTLHSRFLRHLAVSVALNVLFRLGSIVHLLLKVGLAFIAAGHLSGTEDPHVATVKQAVALIDSTWHGIDITISLLATWFLITTWYLLRHYPNEGVDRLLYTILTAVLGAGFLGVLTKFFDLAEKFQIGLWLFLDIVDVAAATVGLLLVGWQLHKTLGRKIKTKNAVVRNVLPWATAFLYFMWGGLQPLYYWLQGSSWYSVGLLMAGVSAIIMTIILCSLSLDDKPEYHSVGARGASANGV